jgi:glycerol-3-phosphate acyltransferase PlsY
MTIEWVDVLLVLGAYLLGAIPNAWVVARLWKHIDIRDYGSGNVGASNVLRTVGRRAAIIVALGDILKGFLVPMLAFGLERSLAVATIAGLAAIIGHNWSVFLRFSGGRGVATLGGAMLALAVGTREPLAFVAAVLVVAVGILIEQAAPATLAAALLATALTVLLPDPKLLTWAWAGATLLLIVKRLLGNPHRPGLAPIPVTPGVLLNRLVYDRDIRDAEAWVSRHPVGAPGEPAPLPAAGSAGGGSTDAELGNPRPR